MSEEMVKEEQKAESFNMMPKSKLRDFVSSLTGKNKDNEQQKEDESEEKREAGSEEKKEVQAEADIENMTAEQLKEALKKERDANDKQKKIIGRQGNEIGDIRKKIAEKDAVLEDLRAKTERTPEEIRDLFDEDPKAALKSLQEDESRNNKIKLEELHKRSLETELAIMEKIPTFEAMLPDMVAILEEDGVDRELINAFKQTPYYAEPATLYYLAKRVEVTKENLVLKEELEKLKSATANASKSIANAATKSSPLLNVAGSGYSKEQGNRDVITKGATAFMPLKELREMRKINK